MRLVRRRRRIWGLYLSGWLGGVRREVEGGVGVLGVGSEGLCGDCGLVFLWLHGVDGAVGALYPVLLE